MTSCFGGNLWEVRHTVLTRPQRWERQASGSRSQTGEKAPDFTGSRASKAGPRVQGHPGIYTSPLFLPPYAVTYLLQSPAWSAWKKGFQSDT